MLAGGILWPTPGVPKASARLGDNSMHEMESNMITLQDCIAFCGLDEEDIHVIAAHHHLPDVIAAQFAAMQVQGCAEAALHPVQGSAAPAR